MTDKQIKRAEDLSVEYQLAHRPMYMGGDAFSEEIRRFNINPDFIAGYEKGLEDSSLTWEDIYSIVYIYYGVFREGQFNKDEVQQLCEEILRRFNEQKGEEE